MKIINKINNTHVPKWGNQKKYIAVHYLGADGQNNQINDEGYGAHFYIFWDGTTYQAADLDAILWQVGTGSYYTQKHPKARNSNTIGIEMCCHCDGNEGAAGPDWWFTEETQKACVELVQYLMDKLGIPEENVLRHYDIVNKTCPAPYVHNNRYRGTWTWEEFKAKVRDAEVPPAKPETWEPVGTATCTGDGVRVRSTPDTNDTNNIIRSLGKGNRFEIDGHKKNGFYHIKVQHDIGWLHGKYVKLDRETEPERWKAIGTATCTGDRVRVRATPNGKILGHLGKGNRFEVDGRKNKGWIHIRVNLEGIQTIAWIHEDYVKYD